MGAVLLVSSPANNGIKIINGTMARSCKISIANEILPRGVSTVPLSWITFNTIAVEERETNNPIKAASFI